ncbi:ATP synthase F1 subunit gamma [Marivirga arenosa]|uniref:ATP synthase gamma chain n=1 Tax=Marivirga arenosa TaxID=3059076 RepID=A0AA51ZW72_9BACT|nr:MULTISPECIES: ATP synthase F1 subunit gamma [unclassified Marivirga]WMN07984.1 ATP synthase F1 subunit gamma [Marivirga sp. ABR2-2]WNB17816.1 ATP synthase F1 subunit gamma [Marivirga sp. BKB1-2]
MANLKEVKNRITSVVSTQQITKAMKMVAAAKLKRAQDRITMMRPYSQKLSTILQNVSGSGEMNNPYAKERPVNNILLILVTSDKGLCGAFNSTVTRKVKSLMEGEYKSYAESGNLHFMTIGKKASDYLKRNKLSYNDQYINLFNNLTFEATSEAAQFIMDEFEKGTYDKVEIIYNEFKNAATQILNKEQFLPIAKSSDEESRSDYDYTYEPSRDYIENELIPTSLKTQLFKALLDSNASEHGARMTAMDKATDNAGELLKELRLTYNRTRQAAITTEILEITAGAEALAAE